MKKVSVVIIIGFSILAVVALYFFLTEQIGIKAFLFNMLICAIGIVAQVFTLRRRKKNIMH